MLTVAVAPKPSSSGVVPIPSSAPLIEQRQRRTICDNRQKSIVLLDNEPQTIHDTKRALFVPRVSAAELPEPELSEDQRMLLEHIDPAILNRYPEQTLPEWRLNSKRKRGAE